MCAALPLRYILIPANPVSKPYPDSLSCAAMLRTQLWRDESFRHIQFIPTLKTSMYTSESLRSFFLSLQYLDIRHVAIISGDSTQERAMLHTYDALEMLAHLDSSFLDSSFFGQLQVFCALGSSISASNSQSFYAKLRYGVHHFITQPFYLAAPNRTTSKHATPKIHSHNTQEGLDTRKQCHTQVKKPPTLLPTTTDCQSFLRFYHSLANLIQSSTPPYCSPTRKISIYCGFLPLTHEEQAHKIHAKQLGICVPEDYIQAIRANAARANRELFAQLQGYPISISYIRFEDISTLIEAFE